MKNQNNNATVNEFFARGIVKTAGINQYGNRYILLVVQDRRNNTMHIDITLDQKVRTQVNPKDRVTVQGYFKGFTFMDDVQKKETFISYLCATSITKSVPELSLRFPGVDGFFYPDSAFRAFVSGKVVETKYTDTKKEWGKIRINTAGGGTDTRSSLVDIRYYCGGRGKLPYFDYVPGDVICARLSIYTPEKTKSNGDVVYYQNLHVEDIGYLEKMPRKKAPESKTLPMSSDIGLVRPDFDENVLLKNEAADMMASLDAPEGDGELI